SELHPHPSAVHQVSWDGRTAQGADGDSFLEFHLPRPQYLAGIRLRYRLSSTLPTYFQMTWRRDKHADYPETIPFARWPLPEGEGTLLVYIADTVQQIRIHPDLAPFEFRIDEIILLTPR